MTRNVIALVNQKGGVGKTTTAFHLGVALARKGYRVLLVDTDPQGGLTFTATGEHPETFEVTLRDVLLDDRPLKHALVSLQEVDLIPANVDLSQAEILLMNALEREKRLRRKLQSVRTTYDFVVVDTPPSLGLLTINALVAADGVIIPVEARFLGLRGLSILMNLIQDMQRLMEGFALDVIGILPTFYEQTVLAANVVEDLQKTFGTHIRVLPPVKKTVRLAESPAMGRPVFDLDPRGDAAQALWRVAEEVIQWAGKSVSTPAKPSPS